MKYNLHPSLTDLRVAPHVGAWIEIVEVCGIVRSGRVAPHVGAWIEILFAYPLKYSNIVAPHVGAWIEIGQ